MGKKQQQQKAVNIPINLPQPPATMLSGTCSLDAREKQLSFRDGLQTKRRSDPNTFLRPFEPTFGKQLAIYTPTVLHSATAGDSVKRYKAQCEMADRATMLMVHWLARADLRTLTSCTLFGMGDATVINNLVFKQQQLPPNGTSRYAGGWRLYGVLQRLKVDVFSQTTAGTSDLAEASNQLAIFWYSLDSQTRQVVLRQELAAVLRTFRPTWCVCNCCKHRRLGIADLHDQLLRAYCEDLDANIRQCDVDAEGRGRRQLYKTVSLITAGMLKARRRPIFDVLAAFTGLRFTDHHREHGDADDRDQEHSDDEGFIEYPPDEPDLYEDDQDGCCDCKTHQHHCPHSSSPYTTDDDDDIMDELLDFSDDDELIDATEGELAIDEGELMGPIASFSRRNCKPTALHQDPDAVEEQLVSDGRLIYRLFCAHLFHHRLMLAFMEAETRRMQMALLREEEEAERRAGERKRGKKRANRRSKRVVLVEGDENVMVEGDENVMVEENTTFTGEDAIDTIDITTDTAADTNGTNGTTIDTTDITSDTAIDLHGTNDTAIDTDGIYGTNDTNGTYDTRDIHELYLENTDNEPILQNTPICTPSQHNQDAEYETIEQAIRDSISALSMMTASGGDDLPPGFGEDTPPPGFDQHFGGGGEGQTYNYWTSSIFGPSLFQPFLH